MMAAFEEATGIQVHHIGDIETLRICPWRGRSYPSFQSNSTQDADSEGEEGRFFVWTPAEIEKS